MEHENECEVEDLDVVFYLRSKGESLHREFKTRGDPLTSLFYPADVLLREFMAGWIASGWAIIDDVIVRYDDFGAASIHRTKRRVLL